MGKEGSRACGAIADRETLGLSGHLCTGSPLVQIYNDPAPPGDNRDFGGNGCCGDQYTKLSERQSCRGRVVSEALMSAL